MKNQNSSFNYHEYRTKNVKSKKPMVRNDMKEIDQLSRKLDTFSFTKKIIRNHLKPNEKPNYQVIREEEEFDLLNQTELSKDKLSLSKIKARNKKSAQNHLQLEIPLDNLQKDKSLEKQFGTSYSNHKKIALIMTDRPNTNKGGDQTISRKLSFENIQKSTVLSTSNSVDQLPTVNIDRNMLLCKINEIYEKIEKRVVGAEEFPDIMCLLDKINYILDHY